MEGNGLCFVCGKAIKKTQRKSDTCSLSCAGKKGKILEMKRRECIEKNICFYCGDKRNPRSKTGKDVCSKKECNEKRVKKVAKYKKRKKENKDIEYECENCGKSFYKTRNEVASYKAMKKKDYRFCTRRCAIQNRTSVKQCKRCGIIFGPTLTNKKFYHRSYCSKMCLGNNMRGYTDIEMKLAKILDELKLKHIPQVKFGKWRVDEFLPELDIVLEANGGYWHDREGRRERDKRKIKYLNKLGIQVLEIEDYEFKDLDTVKFNILNFIYSNKN